MGTPIVSCQSEGRGCGDILYLLIIKKNNYLDEIFFSAQQSCLISIAIGNMLCSYLERKNLEEIKEVIRNCRLMICGDKKYFLSNDYVNLQVFSDIHEFPHRIECVNLVLRGIEKGIQE